MFGPTAGNVIPKKRATGNKKTTKTTVFAKKDSRSPKPPQEIFQHKDLY